MEQSRNNWAKLIALIFCLLSMKVSIAEEHRPIWGYELTTPVPNESVIYMAPSIINSSSTKEIGESVESQGQTECGVRYTLFHNGNLLLENGVLTTPLAEVAGLQKHMESNYFW